MHRRRFHQPRQNFGRPFGFPGFPDRDQPEEDDGPFNRGSIHTRIPIFGRPPAEAETEVEKEPTPPPVPPAPPAPNTSQVVASSSESPVAPSSAPATPIAISVSTVSTTSVASSLPPSMPPTSSQPSSSGQPAGVQTPRSLAASPSASQTIVSTLPAVGATSGPNPGPIVGAVIGGIAGIGLLCLAVIFILRRLRKRKLEESFNPSQFRKSAFVLGDDDDADPFMTEKRRPSQPTSVTFTYPSSSYGSSIHSFASVQQGMPQDARYQYEGQPMVPDHLYQQQPAGYHYTPLERVSPLDANTTRTTPSSPTAEKALPSPPIPTIKVVEPSKSRPNTVYDLDDAYGGIQ